MMSIAIDLEIVHDFAVRKMRKSSIVSCSKCGLQLFSKNGIYAEVPVEKKAKYESCAYRNSRVPKRVRVIDNRLNIKGVTVGNEYDVVAAPYKSILQNTPTQVTILAKGRYAGIGINQVEVLK